MDAVRFFKSVLDFTEFECLDSSIQQEASLCAQECLVMVPRTSQRTILIQSLLKHEKHWIVPITYLMSEMVHPFQLISSHTSSQCHKSQRSEWSWLTPKHFNELYSEKQFLTSLLSHDVRSVANMYETISIGHLAKLLHCEVSETECLIREMVMSSTIEATIDQIQGMIEFNSSSGTTIMDQWTTQIQSSCRDIDVLTATTTTIAK